MGHGEGGVGYTNPSVIILLTQVVLIRPRFPQVLQKHQTLQYTVYRFFHTNFERNLKSQIYVQSEPCVESVAWLNVRSVLLEGYIVL